MEARLGVVKRVDRTVLHVPFHPRCARTMEVYGPGWSIVELIEVTTAGGVAGVGETIQGYTWGRSGEAQFERVRGRNLFDHLWDDSLGAGLQMALFDAAGKLLDVPCHRLLGPQHRRSVPISWWAQSMPGEEWATEAREALAAGFTTMKVKARPWYDIDAQLEAVGGAVPPHFRMDTDFNGLLLGVDAAAPLLARLESRHPHLAIVESPIPQEDVPGGRLLRHKIRSPIAIHMGTPPPMTAIREGVCDGFVLGGGVRRTLSEGALCQQAGMPFWLQMVGTGLTTVFSAQLGAVLEQARWPAINCINIYSHPLVRRLRVEDGQLAVPEGPGLGVQIDRDAVERCRVADDFRREPVRQIHVITWPGGGQTAYPSGAYRGDFLAGRLTGFLPGIRLEVRVDDGSAEFSREYRERFGGP
ncbi:MAG: enolase C-terminal domain-like protein [Candidatus Latescibacterota bacterium]